MTLLRDLRRQLSARGIRPDRRLGQNFLTDASVLERIAEVVAESAESVLEIGPGPGTLTERLRDRVHDVVALEKDPRFVAYLREHLGSRVEIVEGDALKVDLGAWGPGRAVVGNIPYLITSPLLFRLLELRDRSVQLAQPAHLGPVTLMIQREVADRWLAAPGTKTYGIPSVLLQVHAEPRRVLDVDRDAFWPAPRVDSAVVHWVWRTSPAVPMPDPSHFSRVVRAAFSQRRKKLKNALGSAFGPELIAHAAAREDLDRRAETLSVEEFGRLAEALVDGPPP